MLVEFTDPRIEPGEAVRTVARLAGAVANIKWVRDGSARFTLHNLNPPAGTANMRAHDVAIHALLNLDPAAFIRTAKATYYGLEDYQRQRAGD